MEFARNVPNLMRCKFYFLLFVYATIVWSQEPCSQEIKGKVLDLHTNEPIAFATIMVEGTSKGTTTNEYGHFVLTAVCEGELHLIISHVSYKTLNHHHDAHHNEPLIFMASTEINLEGIVVETERDLTKLKSISTTSKEVSIVESFGKSAGDLVTQITGVSSVKTGQNSVKPMVHGLHSNRVLIINNGVRHSYQSWGRDHAPELDPSEIDRLQLVKGAATVRYGSDALGGVILFEPEKPQVDQPLNANMGTAYATNGQAFSGNFEMTQGSHRFAWKAGISGTLQGDLSSPDYQLTNTGKRETGYHVQGIFHQPNYDIELYASHFEQSLGILRGSVVESLEDLAVAIGREPPAETSPFSYSIQNPHQETIHDLYKVKGSFFRPNNEINIQYALQRNARQEYDVRRGTNNLLPSIDLVLMTHTLDADWKITTNPNWEQMYGMQGTYQDNNNIPGTNTTPFVPNFNQIIAGLFSVQSLKRNNTVYELGARYDFQYLNARGRDRSNAIFRNELTYHNLTFTLGFIHPISPYWKLSSNVGTAWRGPNVGELYSFGKHQFNFEYGLWRYEIDNQGTISTNAVLDQDQKEVRSERGLKWIVGLTHEKGKISFEWIPYINFIQDYFFVRPYGITNTVRGPFPYFIHDQTNALFIGSDFDLRIAHSKSWDSEFKIAVVNAQDISNNASFIDIPPLNASYTLSASLSQFKISLVADWTAQQWNAPPVIPAEEFLQTNVSVDRNQTFDFLAAPKGYVLFHSRVSYRQKQWQMLLEVNNVLNTAYRNYTDRIRYFADDLGRNVKLGISYRLSK